MFKSLLTAMALAGALTAAHAADAAKPVTPATPATPSVAPAAPALPASMPGAKAPMTKSTDRAAAHKAKRAACQKQAGDRKGAEHKAFMKDCMGRKPA
ncbi:MAG TPA: PsiF family protein [Methylibium sp.]|nr:PsiF family protein [Methylibium sp.]